MPKIGKDIMEATALLEKGALVAIPTETVYGLAANALDEKAVGEIYRAKGRPAHNPLIMHLGRVEDVANYVAEIPEVAHRLMKQFWPGPLTLLLPRKANVPDAVCAGLPHVAVRVPDHPLTLELLRSIPFPLAAPSANPFGYISPTTPAHVAAQLGDRVPYILDGGSCNRGVESTIVGFEGGQPIVYRLGAITLEDLLHVCNVKMHEKKETVVMSPGMLPYHYSPHTPLYLVEDLETEVKKGEQSSTGVISFSHPVAGLNPGQQVVLSKTADLEEAAQKIYGALHHLDALGLERILVERFAPHGLGLTLNDRLQRAACKTSG